MLKAVNNDSPYYFGSPLQGMRQAVAQANTAAGRISQGEVTPENMVATMEAGIVFKANAKVMKTQDSMLGELLNARV